MLISKVYFNHQHRSITGLYCRETESKTYERSMSVAGFLGYPYEDSLSALLLAALVESRETWARVNKNEHEV